MSLSKNMSIFEVFPYLGVQLASNESFWHDWLVGEPQAGERCQLAVVVSGISHVLYTDIVVYVATFNFFFCEVLANIFRSCFEVIMQKLYVYNIIYIIIYTYSQNVRNRKLCPKMGDIGSRPPETMFE